MSFQKPCYETHEFLLSSVLFYYAVFLGDLNGVVVVVVVDCAGVGDDSFIEFDNVLLLIMQNKI
jgi:hypothetical protein